MLSRPRVRLPAEQRRVPVTITIDVPVKHRLDIISEGTGLSRSALITLAATEWLDQIEAQANAPQQPTGMSPIQAEASGD